MQKLSKQVLDKMIERHVTGKEIDYLLETSRHQDNFGRVKGVYYKEVAEQMGLSYMQFYNVQKSLVEKGIIHVEKNNYHDYDITILDNAYPNPEEDVKKKPYVNTNHDVFYTEEFRKMKPGAKLLTMYLMYVTRMNETNRFNSFKIGVQKLFEKFTGMLEVSKRVIRVYLTQIREFFSIGIVEGLYYITPKKKIYRSVGRKSEQANFSEHEVAVICRRNRIKIEKEKDLEDVGKLISQYGPWAESHGKNILKIIAEGISRSVDKLREAVAAKRRELQPPLVHLWIRSLLGIQESE